MFIYGPPPIRSKQSKHAAQVNFSTHILVRWVERNLDVNPSDRKVQQRRKVWLRVGALLSPSVSVPVIFHLIQ